MRSTVFPDVRSSLSVTMTGVEHANGKAAEVEPLTQVFTT